MKNIDELKKTIDKNVKHYEALVDRMPKAMAPDHTFYMKVLAEYDIWKTFQQIMDLMAEVNHEINTIKIKQNPEL
jgi:hypothetical protein